MLDQCCNGNGSQCCGRNLSGLPLQINIICVLLFLIATTALVKHPDWFGGAPAASQSVAER